MNTKMKRVNLCLVLAVTLGLLLTLSARPGERPVSASAGNAVLAYVLPNDDTGDEIHFINADGTGDKKIWSTGMPGITLTREIHSLAWKPDASELAFVSRFQDICSFYKEDVYAIRPDGSGLRRQTAPYGCGPNPGLPTGTVELTVQNYNGSGVFIVYVEGAPASQSVVLESGKSTTLTFTDVMDYGDGIVQWAVGIVGQDRYTDGHSFVDVIPGETAYATLNLISNTLSFKSPTYSSDGNYMAFISTPYFAYYGPSPMTVPGGIGWYWQPDKNLRYMTDGPSHLHWSGDTPAESVLLYLGHKLDYGYGFYRADHTGSTLLAEVPNPVLGMAVLPDGSGLIFSSPVDMGNWDIDHGGCVVQWVGNIYEYSFASGEITQLSQFSPRPPTDTQLCPPGPFPYELTISPDGSKIAFELQYEGNWIDATYYLDLWIMNRDGSDPTLLVENGLSPAWSPAPIPQLNPLPELNEINPSSASAGDGAFQLTASGSGFVNGSVIRWNGEDLTTTFVDATTLTAQVPADKIAAAGTANVKVYSPGPGGGESSAKSFTINPVVPQNPLPALTTLEPAVVDKGGVDFTLTVNGSNFIDGSVIRWNGTNLTTTYTNATTLRAQVTENLIASTGSVPVTVFNPEPGGGESNALTLSIVNPIPILTSISPTSAQVGGDSFTLTVTGSKFTSESVVAWGGADLTTTFMSATTLRAEVPADKIAAAGTASITVVNPPPGGGVSGLKTFLINLVTYFAFLPMLAR